MFYLHQIHSPPTPMTSFPIYLPFSFSHVATIIASLPLPTHWFDCSGNSYRSSSSSSSAFLLSTLAVLFAKVPAAQSNWYVVRGAGSQFDNMSGILRSWRLCLSACLLQRGLVADYRRRPQGLQS